MEKLLNTINCKVSAIYVCFSLESNRSSHYFLSDRFSQNCLYASFLVKSQAIFLVAFGFIEDIDKSIPFISNLETLDPLFALLAQQQLKPFFHQQGSSLKLFLQFFQERKLNEHLEQRRCCLFAILSC